MSVELARDDRTVVLSCAADEADLARLPALGTTLRLTMKQVSESVTPDGEEPTESRYWLEVWLEPLPKDTQPA